MSKKSNWDCEKCNALYKWFFDKKPKTKAEKGLAEVCGEGFVLGEPKTKNQWEKAELYRSDDMGGFEFALVDSTDDTCKSCHKKILKYERGTKT